MADAVGFIGLGNMGSPMARNLARRGFSLVVHDIDPAKVEPFRAEGASVAGSPQEVAAAARRVICMVSPSGTVDISFKDQELETAFAKQLGVPVLLANVSQQVNQMARAAGFNKEDGTAVIKVLERLAGVRVGRGEAPTEGAR